MTSFAKRAALRLLAAATLLIAAPTLAQTSGKAVKAGFVPKFARYVEFPADTRPDPTQPYYLCIIGHDPFGPLIDRAAAAELIDGHPIAVRRFVSADAEAVSGCHLAFLAGTDDAAIAQMIGVLSNQPVLTITDERIGRIRGMIHLVVIAGRVRFCVDQAMAAQQRVAISSRLLALALEVRQVEP
jgi:hypothetical protein